MLADFNNSFAVRTRNYFCCNLIAVTSSCVLLNDVNMTSFAFKTLQLLRRETPDFISPDLWPPVLQGNAATKLRCGGKYYSYLIRKWFRVTMQKQLLKSANI